MWSGSDADSDSLVYMLLYSYDNGIVWEPLATELTDTSYLWDCIAASGRDAISSQGSSH